jgi:hypothetical protein
VEQPRREHEPVTLPAGLSGRADSARAGRDDELAGRLESAVSLEPPERLLDLRPRVRAAVVGEAGEHLRRAPHDSCLKPHAFRRRGEPKRRGDPPPRTGQAVPGQGEAAPPADG